MSSKENKLDPRWVTGFSDGEGCFHLSITKNEKMRVGWEIQLKFSIGLSSFDRTLLEQIKNLFSVGSINKQAQFIVFRVQSINELKIIFDHFDKYPLITRKLEDYLLFKQAFNLISQKKHLTIEGLRKIVAIKASMNWGLSEK